MDSKLQEARRQLANQDQDPLDRGMYMLALVMFSAFGVVVGYLIRAFVG